MRQGSCGLLEGLIVLVVDTSSSRSNETPGMKKLQRPFGLTTFSETFYFRNNVCCSTFEFQNTSHVVYIYTAEMKTRAAMTVILRDCHPGVNSDLLVCMSMSTQMHTWFMVNLVN